MSIPSSLVEKVKQGKVILFFGSGALFGAEFSGKNIPLGDDLRDILCNKFLNENYLTTALPHVAAMAISQTSLYEVQDFIKDYFEDIEPSDFHKLISTFTWRALFTTNYDLLIEKSYKQAQGAAQTLHVVLNNEDKMDEIRVTNDVLPFFKLHGCVTRTHDQDLPLILTTDQYNQCLDKRSRLFNQLYELAYENTLVFVGHSLFDHNIRHVMLKLEEESPHGQRHYLLKPNVDQIETSFWAEKKITALDITFESFIHELSNSLNESDKKLSLIKPPSSHPIQSNFNVHKSPSDELINFLTNDAEWISKDKSTPSMSPEDFFKGIDQGWSPIIDKIAINRNLENRLFSDVIERPEIERESITDFYLIKGEAGSGKSVLLRQLAWKAAFTASGISIWIKDSCSANIEALEELYEKSSERIFVFWDNAGRNSIEINRFLKKISTKNVKLTLITTERYNEWNVRCSDLDEIVNDTFELRYLSESEIDALVSKLETHKSLGPNLINKSHEDRCKEFKEIHGRQLLVALHEATMGEPFEDIVYDEYEKIIPETARNIYLTVCTLNRLRTPVRAGLISRIHNISFTEFTERFHSPLEKVVIAEGTSDQDTHYRARHSEIAEIVFTRALSDTETRYRQYIEIISKLNISYNSDRTSFRSLIRAKSLNELFPSYEDVNAIYMNALSVMGEDPYLLQQMANYERIRPNGNLEKTIELLSKAQEFAQYDQSILHSLSIAWRDKASKSDNPDIRRKCRGEARAYLDMIASKWGMSSYISVSFAELSLNSLIDLIKDDYASEMVVREAIRKVQSELSESRRRYPGESHIHTLEAKFSELMNDNSAALAALEKSFEENDRDSILAIKLSNTYITKNDFDKAKSFLIKALDRRRSDHKLNYHLAELLRKHTNTGKDDLIYYYRRGYTPGDSNYYAQFWHARFSYLSDDKQIHDDSKNIFNGLRLARLSYKAKTEIRDIDKKDGKATVFYGRINSKRADYGFITIDGNARNLYFPASSIVEDIWDAFQEGDRVSFNIGYNLKGPLALEISY